MRAVVALVCLLSAASWAATAAAQNLVIVNARIVDGKGGVIERGSVVVRDGKIVSASAGAPPAVAGAQRIDAQGRTVMPGFIDAHRHIVQGDAQGVAGENRRARSCRSSSTPGSPRCSAPSAPTRPSRCGSASKRAP